MNSETITPSEGLAWSHQLAMEMAAKDPWSYADQLRIRGLLTQIQALLERRTSGAVPAVGEDTIGGIAEMLETAARLRKDGHPSSTQQALHWEKKAGHAVQAILTAERAASEAGPNYWPNELRRAWGRFSGLPACHLPSEPSEGRVEAPDGWSVSKPRYVRKDGKVSVEYVHGKSWGVFLAHGNGASHPLSWHETPAAALRAALNESQPK